MTLLERLKAKLAQAKTLREKVEAEGREYTEAEAKQLEGLVAECDALQKQIDQVAKLDAMDTSLNQGTGRKTAPEKIKGTEEGTKAEDPFGGFSSAGAFFQAVHQASRGANHIDPRLLASASNVVRNDGGEEGFSVPPAIRAEVFKLLEEDAGDLLSAITSETTSSNSVSYLKDVATPWEAAGIQVHWEQGTDKYAPTPYNALTAGKLMLNGLSVFCTVDEDLIEDAPRLAQRLTELAPIAMRWAINEAIRTGDGVGKPLGYMKSPALITVSKESSQTAGTLLAENVAKMYTRMLPASLKNAHWEVTQELLPALMTLKDAAGNLMWTHLSAGFQKGPAGLLLGRPVIVNEHAEPCGERGDIQFIDPKGYYLAMRTAAASYAESMHVYFDQGLKAFRWRLRLDGNTILTKPINPAKGTLTKSHFVTLAERK